MTRSAIAELVAKHEAEKAALVEALRESEKAVDLLEKLTACGADDEYVWGVQEKIRTALSRATVGADND
jgi:hypothetical protein